MKENENSTRYFSNKHEQSVCEALGGKTQPNSGAGHWKKGDIIVKDASMLIECKCAMSPKESMSVKKEWIDGVKEDAWTQRVSHSALCINFGPDSKNYYIISEPLMKTLVEYIKELNKNG